MIRVKQFDTSPLDWVLKRGVTPVDLSNVATVSLSFQLQDGGDLLGGPAEVVDDPLEGQVRYEWAMGDTDVAGAYYAEWVLTYDGGETERVPAIGWEALIIERALEEAA